MTVIVGSDVFIPCEFSGAGQALPHWRHNSDMFYSLSVPPGHTFNGSGLIVSNIQESMDMDSYSCFIDLFNGYYESTIGFITVLTQVGVTASTKIGKVSVLAISCQIIGLHGIICTCM